MTQFKYTILKIHYVVFLEEKDRATLPVFKEKIREETFKRKSKIETWI